MNNKKSNNNNNNKKKKSFTEVVYNSVKNKAKAYKTL